MDAPKNESERKKCESFGLVWFASLCPLQQLLSVHQTTLFFLGKHDEAVNQYFIHILSLVTDNNPSWISGREENGRRNDFIVNLQESMGTGWDPTPDPWICTQTCISSQTHYWLCYKTWLSVSFSGISVENVICLLCPLHNIFRCTSEYFLFFRLFLYIPSTIFQLNRGGSSWFEPVLS